MEITSGQQYNIREKPTVIPYTFILLLPWYCTIVYCTLINMYNNLSNYVLIIHCFCLCYKDVFLVSLHGD